MDAGFVCLVKEVVSTCWVIHGITWHVFTFDIDEA